MNPTLHATISFTDASHGTIQVRESFQQINDLLSEEPAWIRLTGVTGRPVLLHTASIRSVAPLISETYEQET